MDIAALDLPDCGFSHGFDSRGAIQSQEELEQMDAATLSLSTITPSEELFVSYRRPDLRLYTNPESLHSFSIAMFSLANRLGDKQEIYDSFFQFVRRTPQPILEEILRLDSLPVKSLWGEILDMIYIIEDKTIIEATIPIVMKDLQLIEWYGERVLMIAAWYNCYSLCKQLLKYGICINQTIRFHSWHICPREESTPLITAVVRGNLESAEVLIRGGADVNLRCNGYAPAGHLLTALKMDNTNRGRRLTTMKLLLNHGADPSEPMYEDLLGTKGRNGHNVLCCSETTLFDEAWLMDDDELVALLQTFENTPKCHLTISQIITHAERGFRALEAYLEIAYFPQGLRRRRMQEYSLHLCLEKPMPFLAMLQAGFDPKLPSLGDIITPWGSKNSEGPIESWERDDEFVSSSIDFTLKGLPITLLSRESLQCLLRKSVAIKDAILKSCLSSPQPLEDLGHLLSSGLDVTGEDGVVMMAQAARSGKRALVAMLRDYVDVNTTLRVNGLDYSILLLAATELTVPNRSGLLQNHCCADAEMLELLVVSGADINPRHSLEPALKHRLYNHFPTDSFTWLVDHDLGLTGYSVYDIMLCLNDTDHSRDVLQALVRSGIPVFSPEEPPRDRRRILSEGKHSDYGHPLSFFISLSPGLDFIHRVLDTGIDVNVTGRYASSRTPLQAAIERSDLEVVKELISRGALIYDPDCETGPAPLQIACGLNGDPNPEIAEYLLRKGADPNYRALCERPTMLQTALRSSSPNFRLVKLLLAHGADTDAFCEFRRCIFSGC